MGLKLDLKLTAGKADGLADMYQFHLSQQSNIYYKYNVLEIGTYRAGVDIVDYFLSINSFSPELSSRPIDDTVKFIFDREI